MMVVYIQYEDSMRKNRIAARRGDAHRSATNRIRFVALMQGPAVVDHSGRPQTYEEALVHPLFPKYKG